MAWNTPKTDWDTNPTNPIADDFNRIEENIDFLKTDIETKKGLIVDAINTMGRSVTIANTHAELAVAIKDISDDANAAVGDVLQGKTFYQGGAKKIGTIPSKGTATITPGTANQTIAAGQYLSGAQTILGDPDLVEGNILAGKNIFNVPGNVVPHPPVIASNKIILSNSNWKDSDSTTYIKLREAQVALKGTYRVKFKFYSNGSNNAYARIYVNGSPVGIERITIAEVEFTEDITVSEKDYIQIYVKCTGGNAVWVTSWSIACDVNGLSGIGTIN